MRALLFYAYALPCNVITNILRILTVIFHTEEGLYTRKVCVNTQFWHFSIIISWIINMSPYSPNKGEPPPVILALIVTHTGVTELKAFQWKLSTFHASLTWGTFATMKYVKTPIFIRALSYRCRGVTLACVVLECLCSLLVDSVVSFCYS